MKRDWNSLKGSQETWQVARLLVMEDRENG